MASILRISNLCKTYSITNTQKQEVLKGINLEFDSGELVALLGESGCGKSTLIHILGGLDMDYTGSVVIKGKFIRDFSEKEMDDYRKQKIGMIFQNYNLITHMNILENVEIVLEMADVNKEIQRERALELLELVGLKAHANKQINQLSGGQKQRVAIARALANNPSIILADEPTGALDKESAEVVMSILKKIAQMGKLVILVTHSHQVAMECTRIVTLDNGIVENDQMKMKYEINNYQKFKQSDPRNIKHRELLRLSKRNIWANKKRNFLVSLGISIGIASLILILALSSGLTGYVKDYYASNEESTKLIASYSSKISDEKIETIDSYKGIAKYTLVNNGVNVPVLLEDETKLTLNKVSTIKEGYTNELLYGSLPEDKGSIMINVNTANKIANDIPIASIGKKMTLTYQGVTQEFTVCGIYSDLEEDNTSFILSESMEQFFSTSEIFYNSLYVKVRDITYLEGINKALTKLGFSTETFDDNSQTVLNYIDLGTKVLTGVACVACAVSAIMIIIVLYISVVERTQEIGVLRSIGSRKKDVSRMFMFEAGILGLMGGIMGAFIAFIIAAITNIVCNIQLGYILVSFNPLFYLLGIFISFIVSILSGIAPSMKASNLDPIEALRFE